MWGWLLAAHSVAFALHVTLTLVGLVSVIDKGSQNVPLYDIWPAWNATTCRSPVSVCPACASNVESIADANMSAIIIISQLVTSAFHAAQAWLIYTDNSTYKGITRRGIKALFWFEYSVTASLLAYVVAYYNGILDLRIQLLVVAAQSSLMLLGLLLDVLRYLSQLDWMASNFKIARAIRGACVVIFVVGFFNVGTVWAPGLVRLAAPDSLAPSFVFWIVLSQTILYSSFGFVLAAFFVPFLFGRHRERLSEGWVFAENVAFISLSFASKAVLNTAFAICLVYGKCQ